MGEVPQSAQARGGDHACGGWRPSWPPGFAFAHILLTTTSGYLGSTRVSALASAVILFVGFGIASVLFWGDFRFRPVPKVATEG